MNEATRQSFADYVSARGSALQRTAYLLTGDWAAAEDLVQTALTRVYPRWSHVEADGADAYLRKVIVNTWSSWWRRKWRGEIPTAAPPDSATPDTYGDVDRRTAVRAALGRLPHGQRAVVVLRFHEDLSERETAETLGISVGTVKSQTARALARLREDSALDGYTNSIERSPS
jgi:RNA polymerase sigma-70 factor (sigma-E family)